MEEKEIFRKVADILKELNEQYSYLSKVGDGVDDLEIELFVANASFLADHIRIIQKIRNTRTPQTDQKVVDLVKHREKSAEEPEEVKQPETKAETGEPPVTAQDQEGKEQQPQEETPKLSEEIKFDFSEQKEEPAALEPDEEEAKEPEPKTAEEEVVVHEVVIREKTVSVDTPVADKDHIPTVNDLLSANTLQNTISGKYNRQPAGDLKSMINLNDKLIFVKDLFNGYNLAYSEAVELLNRFDNFEAADNFLKKNYAMKNNWSEKQVTVDKLYEILNRRFTK